MWGCEREGVCVSVAASCVSLLWWSSATLLLLLIASCPLQQLDSIDGE